MSIKRKRAAEFYLFISPWFVVFILLGLIPLLWGLYLSFTDYSGYNYATLRFVGWLNYKDVFTDPDAMAALRRTLIITVINVPLGTFIGFMLAVLLNNRLKGLSIYRTIFYLPSIIPVVATGLMWKSIYAKQGGLLNNLLGLLHIHPVDWLGYDLSVSSLIIMLLWGAGGGLMIYLAGLKGVPQSLYEAAAIDGAKTVQKFRYVTVPLMTPVLFFNVIMGIIASLQILVQPMLLTPGNNGLISEPIQPIYLYMVHAWLQIFDFQRFGYGLAMLWVLFVVVLILSLIVFQTSKYWVYYESGEER
ncbi:carbohydrate ABC transporter permease [Alicyclobacillus fodiniaquatilis]|uniref:Carbohydrate ABC transporter permease n=1 Tax=Alicyclobacillus fodiniaquatilis TaxID=1661150 RepID=A0ABW4JPM9_9BACL